MSVYLWNIDRDALDAALKAACSKIQTVTIQREDIYVETTVPLDAAEEIEVAAVLAVTGPALREI